MSDDDAEILMAIRLAALGNIKLAFIDKVEGYSSELDARMFLLDLRSNGWKIVRDE